MKSAALERRIPATLLVRRIVRQTQMGIGTHMVGALRSGTIELLIR
jgi:hypothetical protein